SLAHALSGVIERHESLRTTFVAHDEQPVQIITSALSFPLSIMDLGSLSVEAGEREARRLAQQEAQQPFDLSRGPLLRVCLLQLGTQDQILLLTMHHIISDGWSSGIFV